MGSSVPVDTVFEVCEPLDLLKNPEKYFPSSFPDLTSILESNTLRIAPNIKFFQILT